MGLKTLSPKRISLVTDPPRWLIPWISLFFTSNPARNATSATMSDAFSTPCPPRPAITILVTLVGLLNTVLRYSLERSRPFIRLDAACRQQPIAPGHNHRKRIALEADRHQFLERGGT